MNLNKIKLFTGTAYNVEFSVNNYLNTKTLAEHIIDVKYDCSSGHNNELNYSVMLLVEVDE